MFTLNHATQFKHHTGWLIFTFIIVTGAICLALANGNSKTVGEISGLDIVGEGSIVLLTLAWMVAALASRPPGTVTSLLITGLGFFLFSVTLDLLDEFFRYPATAHWISMIESYPAAVGMVIMTGALYQWHLEQRALNLQLRRREWDYRDHHEIDGITQLYRAHYWQQQITKLQKENTSAVIALIDINNFSAFNLRHGHAEGDRYLHEVAQLIVMNLRHRDLACRYAGDRFAILLPNVTVEQARTIIDEVKISIGHVAFRCSDQTTATYMTTRSSLASLLPKDRLSSVLSNLLMQLDNTEQQVA